MGAWAERRGMASGSLARRCMAVFLTRERGGRGCHASGESRVEGEGSERTFTGWEVRPGKILHFVLFRSREGTLFSLQEMLQEVLQFALALLPLPIFRFSLFSSFQPPQPSRVRLPPPHLASVLELRRVRALHGGPAPSSYGRPPAPAQPRRRGPGRPPLLNCCPLSPQRPPARRRTSPRLMRAPPPPDAFSAPDAFSTAARSLPVSRVLLPRRAPSPPPPGACAWLLNCTRSDCW
jgi:hypothetical protein